MEWDFLRRPQPRTRARPGAGPSSAPPLGPAPSSRLRPPAKASAAVPGHRGDLSTSLVLFLLPAVSQESISLLSSPAANQLRPSLQTSIQFLADLRLAVRAQPCAGHGSYGFIGSQRNPTLLRYLARPIFDCRAIYKKLNPTELRSFLV